VTEGAVAATLLIGGGLQALQTAALTTGLPFAIILLIMCYSLYLGLKEEHEEWTRRERMRERESYEKVLGKLISQRADKSE